MAAAAFMANRFKDVLNGQTFIVETRRWHAKVIGEPHIRDSYHDSDELPYVDYQMEFTDGSQHLQTKLSVWSPYLNDEDKHPDVHPWVRQWIECLLQDTTDWVEELVVGPPI